MTEEEGQKTESFASYIGMECLSAIPDWGFEEFGLWFIPIAIVLIFIVGMLLAIFNSSPQKQSVHEL